MKSMTVTPKKASEWIKLNRSNRPLRQKRIEQYAAAMSAGVWELNGETIKFNCNGDLVDGQHRLHACIKSGKPFDSYVVHGVRKEAFDTIDQGDKRTIGDVFARQGYKHYCILASAVRWIWRYEANMSQHGAMRSDEANEILERHPALHAAVSRSCELQGSGLMPPGLVAFLLYWTGQDRPIVSDKFFASVLEGDGLEKGTPAHVLHKRLVANVGAMAKLDTTAIGALSIKAWNAHVTKKPCNVLKWIPEEAFPTIIP